MEQLIGILPTIVQVGGYAPEMVEAAVLAGWKHIAGEGLSNQTVAVRLNGQNLVVAVVDAIWQKQLESMRGQLIFRINSFLGEQSVRRIELRIDPEIVRHAHRPLAVIKRKELSENEAPFEPRENEVAFELLVAANLIKDRNLRQAFLGAAMTCIKRLENSQI